MESPFDTKRNTGSLKKYGVVSFSINKMAV